MAFCGSIAGRSTHDLVEAYVLSRRKAKYLSTHLAIRAIRTLSPACAVSDQELEDMIEAAAIAHGVAISFLRRAETATVDLPSSRHGSNNSPGRRISEK